LPRRPEWITLARENLARWSEQNASSPSSLRNYREWQAILEGSIEDVCGVLLREDDEGRRLRQNSPFAGALPYQLVWEIKKACQDDPKST
jgi:hypothetical protein